MAWAPKRRQAIILTNADLIHWRIYAALGGDELISQCRPWSNQWGNLGSVTNDWTYHGRDWLKKLLPMLANSAVFWAYNLQFWCQFCQKFSCWYNSHHLNNEISIASTNPQVGTLWLLRQAISKHTDDLGFRIRSWNNGMHCMSPCILR